MAAEAALASAEAALAAALSKERRAATATAMARLPLPGWQRMRPGARSEAADWRGRSRYVCGEARGLSGGCGAV